MDSDSQLLVLLENNPEAERVLRMAKRKAKEQQQPWCAVYVEQPDRRHGKRREAEGLLRLRTLAEQMGGCIIHVNARSIERGLLYVVQNEQANGRPVSEIVMAERPATSLTTKWLENRAQRIKAKLPDTVRLTEVPLHKKEAHRQLIAFFDVTATEILFSILAVFVATLSIVLIDSLWPDFIGPNGRNKPVIYMIACAFAAGRYGVVPGIVASFVSFLLLSLLYIPPYFEFVVLEQAEASDLLLFLIAAMTVSLLGNKEHSVKRHLLQKNYRLQSLLRLHRIAMSQSSSDDVISMLDVELSTTLGYDVAFFFPSAKDSSKVEAKTSAPEHFTEVDRKALEVCWAEAKTTGVGSPYNPGTGWRFEPMVTAVGEIGVLAVRVGKDTTPDHAIGQLIFDVAGLAAVIIERTELEHIAEENRIQAEREKLRAMLLSSVSHDLKTPLASVIGSLSVYRTMAKHLPGEQRKVLIETALEEAQRLDSFITNILDMTRIESGQVELRQAWVNPQNLIREACKRLRQRLHLHTLVVEPGDAVEVLMDSIMTSQVLQNIIDNAAKYTPAGTVITVSCKNDENGFELMVRDTGPGIMSGHEDKIFDKYTRIKRQDHQIAGTGLGLAIARAVMEAQGGHVKAANHPEGGAVFTIYLPQWRDINEKKIEKNELVA